MKEVKSLGGLRYVGDRDTMTVHDLWNRDSEACGVDELVERRLAVRFDPDTLEQAFWEGFDYCDTCFGKREPTAPYRASSRREARRLESDRESSRVAQAQEGGGTSQR